MGLTSSHSFWCCISRFSKMNQMNPLLWILYPKRNYPWGIPHMGNFLKLGIHHMGNFLKLRIHHVEFPGESPWKIHHGEFTVNLIPRAFFVNSPICLGQRIRFPKGNSPWRISLWWIHLNIPGEFPASFKWTVLKITYYSQYEAMDVTSITKLFNVRNDQ